MAIFVPLPKGAPLDQAGAAAAVAYYGSQQKAAAALGIARSTLYGYLHNLVTPINERSPLRQQYTALQAERARAKLPAKERRELGGIRGFLRQTGFAPGRDILQEAAALRKLPPAERQKLLADYFQKQRRARKQGVPLTGTPGRGSPRREAQLAMFGRMVDQWQGRAPRIKAVPKVRRRK